MLNVWLRTTKRAIRSRVFVLIRGSTGRLHRTREREREREYRRGRKNKESWPTSSSSSMTIPSIESISSLVIKFLHWIFLASRAASSFSAAQSRALSTPTPWATHPPHAATSSPPLLRWHIHVVCTSMSSLNLPALHLHAVAESACLVELYSDHSSLVSMKKDSSSLVSMKRLLQRCATEY
jgi:hypothetical protein